MILPLFADSFYLFFVFFVFLFDASSYTVPVSSFSVVCLSVCRFAFLLFCLSLSVLIYLCLSVRLPNLSNISVFHAPSHICLALPPNTQCGRSWGVCLCTLFLISLLLLLSVTLYPTPSVSVCLSVSCFPVHCSHTC
jgi:hypothetical protein